MGERGSKISPKELEILTDSLVTSRSAEDLLPMVFIPNNLEGLHILDIGGGGSDLTSEFLKKGADAYAVDPLYSSRSQLIGRVRAHLKELSHDRGSIPTWGDYIAREYKALERFKKSSSENPARYLTKFAGNTGFQDGYFDYVFSFSCLTQILALDRDILISAVAEAIRVTRAGGVIQIYPIRESYPASMLQAISAQKPGDLDDIKIRHQVQEELLIWLSAQPAIRFYVDGAGNSAHQKLVIRK